LKTIHLATLILSNFIWSELHVSQSVGRSSSDDRYEEKAFQGNNSFLSESGSVPQKVCTTTIFVLRKSLSDKIFVQQRICPTAILSHRKFVRQKNCSTESLYDNNFVVMKVCPTERLSNRRFV
jgi:hypothetical protein